jgi:hypothetical protein
MCGLALQHGEAVVPLPKPPAAPLALNRVSLLGLEDAPVQEKPDPSADYLLAEMQEPPSRHARMYLALAVLLAAGLLMAWNWHRNGYPWLPQFVPQSAHSQAPQNSNPPAPMEAQAKPPEITPAPASAATPAPATAAAPQPPANPPASSETSSEPPSTPQTQQPAPVAAVIAKPATRRPPMLDVASTQSSSEPAPKTPDETHLLLEGEKYLYGNGVAQDCERAQKNLLAAAAAHSSTAEDLLGTIYASGHCAARDLPTAYHWYAQALRDDPSNNRIESDLKVLWSQMTPAERQIAGGK